MDQQHQTELQDMVEAIVGILPDFYQSDVFVLLPEFIIVRNIPSEGGWKRLDRRTIDLWNQELKTENTQPEAEKKIRCVHEQLFPA